MKSGYICSALTELSPDEQKWVKRINSKLADICQEVTGVRAFVPHEHFDPLVHAHYTPKEVDRAEREQVCEKTSFLLVLTTAPSWGGGIEVEMANAHNVPVFLLSSNGKKVSRLLRGNPAVKAELLFDNEDHALAIFRDFLKGLVL